MATFITRTGGIYGNLLSNKQELITHIAEQLNIKTASLYYYNVGSDQPEQLSTRLDGILSGISYNDNLILQLPTWLGEDYEQALINKFNVYRYNSNSKLIEFFHDDILYNQNNLQENTKLVSILKEADIIIVTCKETAAFLEKVGIDCTKFVYVNIFDCLLPFDFNDSSKFSKKINIIEPDNNNLQKLLETCQQEIHEYGNTQFTFASQNYFHHQAQVIDQDLPYRLHQNGGFGIIWPMSSIDSLCSSYYLGMFLSVGLPLIVKSHTVESQWVSKYNLGIVIDSLESLDMKISSIGEKTYQQFVRNVNSLGTFTRNGVFIRHALFNAVDEAFKMSIN